MLFQQKYDLLIDRELNGGTLTVLNRLRCVEENNFRVKTQLNKWHSDRYFHLANGEYHRLAEKVFTFENENRILVAYVRMAIHQELND